RGSGRTASIRVRRAGAGDNEALVALALACPMEGDVGLCVSRAPDFFALNRLEGEAWEVACAEERETGAVVGCAAVAERRVWLHGAPAGVVYAYDLKVHPAHRGGPAADALSRWVRDECERRGGPDVPVFLTILAGNASMERRTTGRVVGVPRFARFATVRSHSITLLGRRRLREERTGLRIARARPADVEEMAALWETVARDRQLAPVLDAERLAAFAASAPGLGLESYRVARRRDGRIAGFAAFWDQSSFKQLRVTRYSPRLAAVRLAFNTLAPLVRSAPLPPAGGALRHATAFNVCAPAGEPAVLRALVRDAHDDLRAEGYSLLTVGLDLRDPLAAALDGLFAQPTDVHAYACSATGDYAGPALDARVLHHEIALV
ncbi:MAG TPA: hypothetical protein VFN38_08840, partial [Gemmatimonadaceae bacterium]|nr:hypothetical protein [Gemmatimonadaceae bacterium]